MILVKGNKEIDIHPEEVLDEAQKFKKVHLDLGTGDGRLIYELALKDPSTLFVGIDPVEKQLRTYSVKSVRKKMENVMFLVSSFENLPFELRRFADKVSIILPWGSLLEKVVKPTPESVDKIRNLLKPNGEFEMLIGYSKDLESSETERLDLPELTEEYIDNVIIKAFISSEGYFALNSKNSHSSQNIVKIDSNWAKKLVYGKNRQMYFLRFNLSI